MDFAQVAISNLIGIMGFALVVAGVMKAFQMASALNEIKELLADIKRGTITHASDRMPAATTPAFYTQSGDEMLRALSDIREPAVQPEIVQPR